MARRKGGRVIHDNQAEDDEEREDSQAHDRGLDELPSREHEQHIGLLPGGQPGRRRRRDWGYRGEWRSPRRQRRAWPR